MITQDVIDKLKLQESKHTIGQSFIYKARIFFWPAMTDTFAQAFICECDTAGIRLTGNRAMILVRWPKHFKWFLVTYEALQHLDAKQLQAFVTREFKNRKPIGHGGDPRPRDRW